jgi:hypothetical protein
MNIDRKAAIAAYKDRKVEAGIFAIRCLATGAQWLGQAPDIATIQTRHWFSLRLGSHSNRALQAAWLAQGEAGMAFEVLELLPDEDDPIARTSQLRDALRRWRNQLAAPAV